MILKRQGAVIESMRKAECSKFGVHLPRSMAGLTGQAIDECARLPIAVRAKGKLLSSVHMSASMARIPYHKTKMQFSTTGNHPSNRLKIE